MENQDYGKLSDEEFSELFTLIVTEKTRRESRVTAYKKLTEAVTAVLPAIQEYQKATGTQKIGITIDTILENLTAEKPESPAEEIEEIEEIASGGKTWVQPTGAHDAYNVGDTVTYQNQTWRSTQNGNVWSPAAYPQGWEKI